MEIKVENNTIDLFSLNVGISENIGPSPLWSNVPLRYIASVNPTDIEAIQNVMNAIPIADLSELTSNPASVKILDAKDTARWNPTTIDNKIFDASNRFSWDNATEDKPTNINVRMKILLKLLGEIMFNKNATNIIPKEIEIDLYLEKFSIGKNGLILPTAAAKAAASGKMNIFANPSLPIPPLTAKLIPK